MIRCLHALNWFLMLNIARCDHECGLENVYCHRQNLNYRSVDGSCNNFNHPNWGTRYSVYDRLIPAKYGNKNALAGAKSGKELPNARNISITVFTDETHLDKLLSASAMGYGQLVAHDLGQNYLNGDPSACCDELFHDLPQTPERCASIKILENDPHYSRVNATCLSILRTLNNHQMKCSLFLPNTTQISAVTSYLDLSIIYGNTEEINEGLRTKSNGLLNLDCRHGHEWFTNSEEREFACPLLGNVGRCYRTGDFRANQNPHLTILHILWAREHNRIARELAKLNPHWTDEKLFQITRTIVIAEHQHITYYGLLPCYAGYRNLLERNILFRTNGFVIDYHETMRPHIFNEFAQAAFRHFHGMSPGILSLVDSTGCPYRSISLRDHTNRPELLEKEDNFDSLLRGMATQPSLSPDAYCDTEMTNYFFPVYHKVGFDIRAMDIQRSRDHGLGSYNDMREACGLGRVKHFYELLDVMDIEAVQKLISLYEDVDDIDLIVAGSLEVPDPGTLTGPTFLCIIYEQFYRTRKADRFFFESIYTGFTYEQLIQIRKSSISRLFCDNGNEVTNMQKNGFLQVSESNPRVPCRMIPGPDLTFWKEGGHFDNFN